MIYLSIIVILGPIFAMYIYFSSFILVFILSNLTITTRHNVLVRLVKTHVVLSSER